MRNSVIALSLAVVLVSTTITLGDVSKYDKVLNETAIQPRGERYEATVPDTLDLAERARASINCMAGIINPEKYYYSYTNVSWSNPVQLHALTWNLPCEYVFSFPLARAMCGSEQALDIEAGTMRSYLSQLDDDGVIYSPMEDLGKPKGSSFPDNIGFVAFALANWHERDGRKEWLDALKSLCKGFEKMAIKVDDRAFYPPEYCYTREGKWVPEGRGTIAEFDGKEPASDQQGFEGAVKYYQAAPLQAFVKCYQYSHDEKALEMAQRLKRFMLKPDFWRNTDAEGYSGVERGVFGGHYHGNLIPLWALLNLSMATSDERLKDLVRSGYEHSRRYMVPGMGWSPCYMYPGTFGTYHKFPFCDSCNVADSALLAVKLSEAGLGDYWDDAEGLARNQLAENQFLDKQKMANLLGGGEGVNEAIERFYGGFFQTEPTILYPREGPMEPGCCIASGPWGLYAVWHGITQFDKGVATVNMFLNRASPWLDIDSYLPYEGKVIIHNKQAHTLSVRIPKCLSQRAVKCFVNDQPADPAFLTSRMVFSGLKARDEVRLEFPVEERVENIHINGIKHTLTFRGLDLIDITPRNKEPATFATYERDNLKASTAPMRKVERFIAERLIPIP
jgi:hypothetical protein